MKRIFSNTIWIFIFMLFAGCNGEITSTSEVVDIPDYKKPNHYICYQAPESMNVDGIISDAEWGNTEWSVWFKDIEGEGKDEPLYKTRMKMQWDEQYLYIAAELEEPHVWAKITERDEVIFFDNDFEVFIDPNDDTHAYYELEVNAFETAWDLLLLQPYRDGGPAVDSWDIQGLQVGTEIYGTINNPDDVDKGWTLEIAIPFKVLEECAPGGEKPAKGDQWRINFSRVEWKVEVKDGQYEKQIDPSTGKSYAEDNWVWSPQGYINMHMPEFWGYVQFEGADKRGEAKFEYPDDVEGRWMLRNLYYRQFAYNEQNGEYADELSDLSWPSESLMEKGLEIIMETGKYGYQAYIEGSKAGGILVINEKGRIVKK